MHPLLYKISFVCIALMSFITSAQWLNPVADSYIQFTNKAELDNWVIINDTVMGGRSQAALEIDNNSLVFKGRLSLQNNGGFASTRRIYSPLNWAPQQAIEIKVKGDGRAYQFRLRTNRRMDGVAYVANFETVAGESQTFTFQLSEFQAQWRGRQVVNAAPLSFDDVTQLGFMLADKTPGDFALHIEKIEQLPPVI